MRVIPIIIVAVIQYLECRLLPTTVRDEGCELFIKIFDENLINVRRLEYSEVSGYQE